MGSLPDSLNSTFEVLLSVNTFLDNLNILKHSRYVI